MFLFVSSLSKLVESGTPENIVHNFFVIENAYSEFLSFERWHVVLL